MREEDLIDYIIEATETDGKADILIKPEWSFCVRKNPYYMFVSLLHSGKTVKTDFIKIDKKNPVKTASEAFDLMKKLAPELIEERGTM